jgi:16S rRNA (uracil1498-N3)-methyltransferase
MHRFFVPASWIQGNEATLIGPQAQQIARVLRMQPGDVIVLLDNSGWEIETRLKFVDPHAVRGEVERRRLSATEPRTKISVYQSVLKSRRFEFVLQKGTEVGIVEFVPLIAERCVVSDLDAIEKRRRRWELIVQEAAEQSRRSRKPALRSATLFPQACDQIAQAGGLSLILWEGPDGIPLRQALHQPPERFSSGHAPFGIQVLVGPEGGFARHEVDIARRYRIVPVTLGPRILRAETAGIVAASAILFELGDLG